MVSKECLEEIEYYSKHPWNEKKAKDMFEDLGYELMVDCKYYLYYQKPLKENPEYEKDYFHISFEKDDKAFIKTYGDDNSPEIIDMQELKAINKQVEELGW